MHIKTQPSTKHPPPTVQTVNHTQSINGSINRYVVLANILANSDINPFAATEAKVYQVRTSKSIHGSDGRMHVYVRR